MTSTPNNAIAQKILQEIPHIQYLPISPAIAQQISKIDPNDPNLKKILTKIIEVNPQIFFKILQEANLKLKGPFIFSASQAILTIGLLPTLSILLDISRYKPLESPIIHESIYNMWIHSIAIAIAAQSLNSLVLLDHKPHDDLVFFAGLTHDIGFSVLQSLQPFLHNKLQIELMLDHSVEGIETIEHRIFCLTHCEVGQHFAAQSGFPPILQYAILHHHNPKLLPHDVHDVTTQILIDLIYLADSYLFKIGAHETPNSETSEQQKMAFQRLNIQDPCEAIAMIHEVGTQAAQELITPY